MGHARVPMGIRAYLVGQRTGLFPGFAAGLGFSRVGLFTTKQQMMDRRQTVLVCRA